MDDNFVIICPLCKARLSLNGAAANENSQASEIVWNKHVECGDCDRQKKINAAEKSTRPTSCQVKGCWEKLTVVKSFKCTHCQIYTCFAHRYGDSHGCGVKVKKPMFGFLDKEKNK